jgi:hypothetical protein
MFITLSAEVVAYCHPILSFVLMTFGRHRQQLGDKSRFVIDSLHIVPESLAKKALYVSLKMLPPLIRCLLNHGNHLPFSDHSFLLPAIASLYQPAVIIQFLLPKNLLDLTDLFLNYARYLFTGTFSL